MNHVPQTTQYTCPCCKGFIGEAAPIEAVLERVSSGQQKLFLSCLAKRIGQQVSKETIMTRFYSDRRDGGPDNADAIIAVQLSNLRRLIGTFGWSIITTGGGHGTPTFYRLTPTEVSP
ncbi:hypothetical protein RMR10_004540 [Agrobacterium rosae]|uniref:hypothetical protein n=1 Tax=Agrobacterium rosae TaxID=1972867 RepID=UPI002A0FEF5F|nr:hypothetical protein [Agrobacterium rosae]MDX8315610.1 hypothetical protein [Agrobacterium rosae]